MGADGRDTLPRVRTRGRAESRPYRNGIIGTADTSSNAAVATAA